MSDGRLNHVRNTKGYWTKVSPIPSSDRSEVAGLVSPSLLRWPERVLDLFLDARVVLGQDLLLVLGEDPERDADQALLELHVEPVLAVRDALGEVEVQAAKAGARVAELDLVVRHGPL